MTLVPCPACRRHLDADARACPFCGAALRADGGAFWKRRVAAPTTAPEARDATPPVDPGPPAPVYGAPPRPPAPAYGAPPPRAPGAPPP